jgi:hypothetical protein
MAEQLVAGHCPPRHSTPWWGRASPSRRPPSDCRGKGSGQDDEAESGQLQATLHHRTVTEQAKGVLAEAGGLDMHQAYLALRGYARAHHRRLSDVATADLDPAELLTGSTDASRP